jgi:hypothetical protein
LALFSNAQINQMRKLIKDQEAKEEEAFKKTGSRILYLSKQEIN